MGEWARVEVRVEGVVQGVGFRPFVYSLATRLGLHGRVGNDAGGVFAEVEGPRRQIEAFLTALELDPPPLAAIDQIHVAAGKPGGATGFTIVESTAGGRRGVGDADVSRAGAGAVEALRAGGAGDSGGGWGGATAGERGDGSRVGAGGTAGVGAACRSGGVRRRPGDGVTGRASALISPDTATCDDCLRELADPADRRFGYPFVNCVNCGPRFTIVRDVPYDRPLTTMAGFPMCRACAAEYHDPGDRRFHAQPICCPACGPRLRLAGPGGAGLPGDLLAASAGLPGDPVAASAALLRDGRVLAVKGLGGYHLAALAGDEAAVSALRRRKHREDKPFAVMAAGVPEARLLCEVSPEAEALLTGRARPIVLLPRLSPCPVAAQVAPGGRELGLMLPYTPLHHLLLAAVGAPIVLTSGNVSDEPIVHVDSDAFERLAGIADAFLTHDRPIHVRADDSVVRPSPGGGMVLRRSRGYVPEPVELPREAPRPILACGAELKNTFCLASGARAFLSPHIGDLEDYPTLRSFTGGIAHLRRLTGIEPEVVAHDLHPEYLSAKHAREIAGVELVGVQHHHAHIAACLADNGERGPVIGVAFDGLGYGTDGTLWGGEFLLADLFTFQRAGHLAPVPMPGGPTAVRQPWRMAAAYLDAAYDGHPPPGLAVARRNAARWADVLTLARSGVGAPPTSSAGRLFDAVSALLGLRDTVAYEGQAAIELEQRADPHERGTYHATITPSAPSLTAGPATETLTAGPGTKARTAGPATGAFTDEGGRVPAAPGGTPHEPSPLVVSGADLVRASAADLLAGAAPPAVAARFHNGLADAVARCCAAVRDSSGLDTVALSGGVFQNRLLLDRTTHRLRAAGFRVLTHTRVPPNDAGISLGQAAIAAARDHLA
ncbi:carbamoyltransferase HypF [Sphaerisporangium sp. TRM90804]|uniref:carbamoyltransferase HypF n=1 Tax=Sphaerisporangium sp. TRM90804 TaxID=3031113 RepID=UPI002449F74E|nr:carbamoyltransferase HypF [Sphaerisporangium sp. TRM90804]MDH2430633.1 carbamoyltransferase HypF [Sphaerisporangium sp. TRM90804]